MGARYFAEKGNGVHPSTREGASRLFPELKEIVLIRDPRDVYCSHLAYFRPVNSETAFKEIEASCRYLSEIRRRSTGREIFIRYEDLLAGKPEVFDYLSQFLGIGDLSVGKVQEENAVFRVHATSQTPQTSVGRWRELPEKEVTRCTLACAEFLAEFGYADNDAGLPDVRGPSWPIAGQVVEAELKRNEPSLNGAILLSAPFENGPCWNEREIRNEMIGFRYFRWTCLPEVVWPPRRLPADTTAIRIPYLMEVVAGFAQKCQVFLGTRATANGGKRRLHNRDGDAARNSTGVIRLITPPLRSPQEWGKSDARSLGLAVPVGEPVA